MFRPIWRHPRMFCICSHMDGRITVTPRELATAMTVWLRVMPTRIWRAYENYQMARQQKRHVENPEVERAVAEYLAGKFDQAGWEVSHEERGNIFADPIGQSRQKITREVADAALPDALIDPEPSSRQAESDE
jgi:hypothetical protein